jgi:hypothetical protein
MAAVGGGPWRSASEVLDLTWSPPRCADGKAEEERVLVVRAIDDNAASGVSRRAAHNRILARVRQRIGSAA